MKRLYLVIIIATYSLATKPLEAGPILTQIFGWGFNGAGAASGTRPSTGQLDLASGVVRVSGDPLTNVTAIAAGYQHSLALRSDGTVVGWGFNNCGQATGIEDGINGIVRINGVVLSNVVAISAGFFHSLALLRDGNVVAWGNDGAGKASVPAGLSNVIAISAGWSHSLALKKDGTVVMWPNPIREGWRSPGLSSLSNIVAVATGKNVFGGGVDVVLKADSTVLAWSIKGGQIHAITGLSNVVAVAAGTESLALTKDGAVFEIGLDSDEAKQLGGVGNAVAIAAGGSRSLALTRDGTVEVVWGDNYPYAPLEPVHLTNVIGIAAGDDFCLAIQANSAGPITNAFPELPRLFWKP
jgi:alpha-tubulin suppressor-like RCC1 family protein